MRPSDVQLIAVRTASLQLKSTVRHERREQNWHPNPVAIGGQLRPIAPHRVPIDRAGRLQKRKDSPARDFEQNASEATIKLGVSTNFNRAREFGMMKKGNYMENICFERSSRCAQ